MPDAVSHPTPQELSAFNLGRLREAAAAAVAGHLESCAACRKALEKLPPDSFVSKVRAAKPGGSSVPPGRSLAPTGGSPSMKDNAAETFAPPDDLPPELANYAKYRFVRELGRGGMGIVYQAVQTLMERTVAIKVINPSLFDHPDALARFLGEVKVAAQLDHPNIVRAYDAEQVGSLHLLVMEFVEGWNLADLVYRKGPLTIALACNFIRQAALGLQHASEQEMVHRDIKPSNLMLTPQGRVKILDFGLARLCSEKAKEKGLTAVDDFLGTLEYMSPEQGTDAHTADIRADLYSLGCTLYFLLTGRPPFGEDTVGKLFLAHIEKEPPPLHKLRAEVPEELSRLAARLLAKDPARRYQKPGEVAQAIMPFIKPGSKPGVAEVAAPPAGVASPATGTVTGADTSRLQKFRKDTVRKAHVKETLAKHDTAEPLEDLADAGVSLKRKKRVRTMVKPVPAAWYCRKPLLAAVGAAVLALGLGAWLLAGVVFKAKTKDGVIVLDNLPRDAEVLVDGEKWTVTWGSGGRSAEITVKPGTRQIVANVNGLKVIGQAVVIEEGGREVLTAKLEGLAKGTPPGPPAFPDKPARPSPAADGNGQHQMDQALAVGSVYVGIYAYDRGSTARGDVRLEVTQRKDDRFEGKVSNYGGLLAFAVAGTVRGKDIEWIFGDILINKRNSPEPIENNGRFAGRIENGGITGRFWTLDDKSGGHLTMLRQTADKPVQPAKDLLQTGSTWRGVGEYTFWALPGTPPQNPSCTLRITQRTGDQFKAIYEFGDGSLFASKLDGSLGETVGASGKRKVRAEFVQDIRGNAVQRAHHEYEGTIEGPVLTIDFFHKERNTQRISGRGTIKFTVEENVDALVPETADKPAQAAKDILQPGSTWRGVGEYTFWGLPGPMPPRKFDVTLRIMQRSGDQFKAIYEPHDGSTGAVIFKGSLGEPMAPSGKRKMRCEGVRDIRGNIVQSTQLEFQGTIEGSVLLVDFSTKDWNTRRVTSKGTLNFKAEEDVDALAPQTPAKPAQAAKDILQPGSTWRGMGEYTFWGDPGPMPRTFDVTLRIMQRSGDQFKAIYEVGDGAKIAVIIKGSLGAATGTPGKRKIRGELVRAIRGKPIQPGQGEIEGTIEGPVLIVDFAHKNMETGQLNGKGTLNFKAEQDNDPLAAPKKQ